MFFPLEDSLPHLMKPSAARSLPVQIFRYSTSKPKKAACRQASCRQAPGSKRRARRAMTAAGLVRPKDERNEFNPSPGSPPLKPIGSNSRKRPRTSSLSSSTSGSLTAVRSILPPYPPNSKSGNGNGNGNYSDSGNAAAMELGLSRPQTTLQPRTYGTSRSTQLPYIHSGEKGSSHFRDAMVATQRSGEKHVVDRLGWAGDCSSSEGENKAGGSDGTQLSKSAKLMEEDRKKVASIRSFLLNFLEERDCSIKKRLVGFFVIMNISRRANLLLIVS